MTIPVIEDMAATLTFSPGQPCAGGEHIVVQYTLTVDGLVVTRNLHIDRAVLRANPLTVQDADDFALLAARIVARQVSLLGVRSALSNTIVDLTAVGV